MAEDQLQLIADNAMHDFWTRTNPRPINGPAEVLEILKSAW